MNKTAVIPTLVRLIANANVDLHITLITLTLESLDAILKNESKDTQYGIMIRDMFMLFDGLSKLEKWKNNSNITVSKMANKIYGHLEKIKVLHIHMILKKMLTSHYYADCYIETKQ